MLFNLRTFWVYAPLDSFFFSMQCKIMPLPVHQWLESEWSRFVSLAFSLNTRGQRRSRKGGKAHFLWMSLDRCLGRGKIVIRRVAFLCTLSSILGTAKPSRTRKACRYCLHQVGILGNGKPEIKSQIKKSTADRYHAQDEGRPFMKGRFKRRVSFPVTEKGGFHRGGGGEDSKGGVSSLRRDRINCPKI